MKAIRILGLLTAMSCMLPQIATAQDPEKPDSTGYPGDNFSLEGALELFKNSNNLEEFEKKLNDKSANVNNLDLNNDGKVDYVKVTDKTEKDVHAIILRINVSAKESQDVAVIAVEKTGDKTAVAQIVGDEELYGKDIVVEPIGKDEVKSGSAGKGPSAPEVRSAFVIVNVWYWPCVQYIYTPGYVAWNSPWYWGYYPSYWYAWEPYPWYYHYNHCAHYRHHHHVVYVHRVNHGPVYRPHRQSSPMVHNHYRAARQSGQPAAGNRASSKAAQPAGRQSEMKKEPASRPVEGTQGTRNMRRNRENEISSPPRQNSSTRPVERPVERRNAEPVQRQRNQEITPRRAEPQISPRQRSPQVSPQRANPQRSNPPMRQSPMRSAPRGGGRR